MDTPMHILILMFLLTEWFHMLFWKHAIVWDTSHSYFSIPSIVSKYMQVPLGLQSLIAVGRLYSHICLIHLLIFFVFLFLWNWLFEEKEKIGGRLGGGCCRVCSDAYIYIYYYIRMIWFILGNVYPGLNVNNSILIKKLLLAVGFVFS